MKIIILAAGYGTRLYPLTLDKAKPLVEVNNKPIINFLIDKIDSLRKKFTIEEVRVVVNDKFFESFLEWKKKYDIDIKVINDGSNTPEDRLGAIKDMKLAIGGDQDDWLILGGDNLFEDSLEEFLKFSLGNFSYPSLGLYDVKTKEEAKRFGIVELDKQRMVTEFKEKPKEPKSTLAASCVYYFPKESLQYIDKFINESKDTDASGSYIAWLLGVTKVFGYTLEGKWIDIGHFDSLKEAAQEFK